MELNILTDIGLQESELSVYEISFARSAQIKKNARLQQLANDKAELRKKLLSKGTFRSSLLASGYASLESECNADIAQIQDDLRFQIAYFEVDEDGVVSDYAYPTNPNYSLSAADRYYVVYNYYMTMSDPSVRFALFQSDSLAKDYLSTLYSTLYDKLHSYVTS